MAETQGKVYMIGAGPGCGGLISVRGLHILQRADCVLYDRLIGKELLNFVSPDAELIYVGKDRTEQEAINSIVVKKSRKYKTIVRLKGGDPMIFGRATEELKSLIANKIDFEIIPGITAASAAAASSGVILTDRNTASSVTFVTGQTAEGRLINIDFAGLVKLKGTIVFYMAVGNMRQICQKLIKAGIDRDTNAVVVANASLANQKIIGGSVFDIARKCAKEKIEPPAVLIIGKKCVSLLESQPLFGKKILITRDSFGNAEFACRLSARGAEAIDCPTFEIQDLTGKKEFKLIVDKIKNFDWVFFTSPTGVKLFFKAIKKLNKDSRVFGDAKIACIGSETANMLECFGIIADFVPEDFTSDALAKEFIAKYKPKNKKILLLRSALAEELKLVGAKTKNISLYTAMKIKISFPDNIDWITFASSFAVKCFFEDVKIKDIQNAKIASIGPKTTETLKIYGAIPTVEAKEHTIDGLIAAMEEQND